jgi:hypothetical protein
VIQSSRRSPFVPLFVRFTDPYNPFSKSFCDRNQKNYVLDWKARLKLFCHCSAEFIAGTIVVPELMGALVRFDKPLDTAIDTIVKARATAKSEMEKIVLSRVAEAIRIWNEQRGVAALSHRIASPGGK